MNLTLRDQVMDKYWLQFLASEAGRHSDNLANDFWWWFVRYKQPGIDQDLAEYL